MSGAERSGEGMWRNGGEWVELVTMMMCHGWIILDTSHSFATKTCRQIDRIIYIHLATHTYTGTHNVEQNGMQNSNAFSFRLALRVPDVCMCS